MVKEKEKTALNQEVKTEFFYGYIIVALVFLILTIIFVAVDIYGIFFEPLIAEFKWSRTIISGASALNNLTFGIFIIISAKLCEKFSLRLIVGACGILLGLGYFLMSQINSVWQLYLYFGIIISFSTSIYIALISTIARWFVKRRGLMTGIAYSGLGLAATVGPPVANWLITTYDWRQSFLILGIASTIIIVPAALFLKRDPQHAGQSPYGTSSEEPNIHVLQGVLLQEALRTRQFWLICGMYFIFLFCHILVLVHIVIHAIGLGLDPASAANILAIYGFVSIISVNIMGLSGDRFGNRPIFAISFLLLAISFFWLLIATQTWQLYLFAVILGLSYGGMQVLFSPLVAELFGLKAHGVILGTAAFGGAIGAALGPLFAGYIFDEIGSYNPTFIICAVLAIIAIALTLLLKPMPGNTWQKQ